MKTNLIKIGKRLALLGMQAIALAFLAQGMAYATGGTPSGSGTEGDPFLIADYEDLKVVGTDTSTYSLNSVYRLTSNIDASASALEDSGKGFVSIGTNTAPFTGVFHGSGCIINDLMINRSATNYIGLFGNIISGTIDSLGMAGGSVTGGNYVGFLSGRDSNSTVNGCYSTGSVMGGRNVGGLVGLNYNGGTIDRCYATGAVTGSDVQVGGLVGLNYNGTVNGCYATGFILGRGKCVGGLVGYNYNGIVSDCYAEGSVTGDSSFVGGLVGVNQGSSTVNGCYSTGSVTGYSGFVGGLVGFNDGGSVSVGHSTSSVEGNNNFVGGFCGANYNSGLIIKCYSKGAVTGNNNFYVGGLVGGNDYNSTVSECHAVGTVTSNSGYVGGLVGINNNSKVDLSYASGSVLGLGSTVGGLIGMNDTYSTIDRSMATGSVTAGTHSAGGLVGYNDYNSTISKSYATGTVASLWAGSVGGLVGYNYWSIISECYSTGPATGTDYIGGLAGGNAYGTINNCYSTGEVNSYYNKYIGGLTGYSASSTVSGSYWNKETTMAAVGVGYISGGSAACYGLTTAQMKQDTSFNSWDFSATWRIRSDSTYPSLQSLDNAPFAFFDRFYTQSKTFLLSNFILNDCDMETTRANLVLHVNSVSVGTTDSVTTLTFPDSIAKGTVDTVKYRVGEIRSTDTLWGNIATAYVIFDATLEGNGTEETPYLIPDYASLKMIGSIIYGYELDKVYRLVADIDASPSATENSDSGFVPIGTNGMPFIGAFHGGGHVIKNLMINRPATDYVGLFGYISVANIDSLGLSNCYVAGNYRVGGLVGYSYQSTVMESYATGSVMGYFAVGGIVGYNSYGILSECYATGPVMGSNNYVGGLVGLNYTGSKVNKCYATGSVLGNSRYVGGLVGANYSNGAISGCYSTGSVSGSNDYVGGLVGANYINGTVSGCYWNTETSGLISGVGTNNGSADITGVTTVPMKQSSSFMDWSFDTTWTIRSDSTYPGLQSLDNAPFAFYDTLISNRSFELSRLLLNDCDVETARNNLMLRIISVSLGTTDSVSTLIFPDSTTNGIINTVKYRIGENRSFDTLWGNIATAYLTLDTSYMGVESSKIVGLFRYELRQNHPNPFNTRTTISYQLAVDGYVSLKVYDMLGRKAATLVDGLKPAGMHRAIFNVQRLAEGIYFYRLQAGTFTETKKLLLLK
ncbi:MAG: hypothetical protein A2509_08665 [Candidatus Edwardsbacteria bacterium RIFOXYD12_FULL_50_11]|uniref:Secretion system C-terminal sorting domain-containing protein n=1 Tax=Candidatus Edwardsbacteria bacterium GWF2_54_11 TaxID=1817851 RepID=A0A1F5RFV0_9BACT|nr:MAG: hypothetical protein A2502_02035 [Candidatus Edwardsbacteria bacterium RifOxyC12_full_54_24]OGF09044.1 MAG: hypothetical protein A2273_10490 [Candidatus Edwardsbacteria bacterium RifOxyA12_full_54_48]OGF12431.1 MAG: hypothetical protein A3K15_01105 [Candidatus Edwardsbacteria bacterium GWE2_54_12]OGF12931.1 MAG: hypothetical protein A2024_11945 [Candidatus Edwardsbacteria bacterium GWF2_54_11]OGF17465.1 MAG: hypothetical protein A2509_08665 [Candidatus Edwardsbacteria bacterium RIFOXYD1